MDKTKYRRTYLRGWHDADCRAVLRDKRRSGRFPAQERWKLLEQIRSITPWTLFCEQGVWLYLSRMDTIYRVKVRIEPCRVLTSGDPTALFQADKKQYHAIVEKVDSLLQPYGLPRSIDRMKISRMDLTCDLTFQEAGVVQQYIRTLQKAFVLPHYKRVCFREGDGKAKNVREANKHSCRQQCRQAAFFAYDKTAQLQMIGRLPEGRLGKRVLRARGRAEPRCNEAASRKTEVELSVFEAGREASRQGDRLVPKTRV